MSGTIQILNGEKKYCTAKDAMRYVISYIKSDEPHAIRKVSCDCKGDSDSEAELFIKMFGRFLHKNHGKIFLLAETDKLLAKMIELLPERYTGIRIASAVSMEEDVSDDMLLNRINGDEVDCVIAALSEKMEDDFYEKYHNSLDTKIWVELGTDFRVKRKRTFSFRQFFSKE